MKNYNSKLKIMEGMKCPQKFSILLFAFCIIQGCASQPFNKPSAESGFMKRAQSKTDQGVTVTVSAMGPKESQEYFGVPLAKKNIQPVWIKIENNGSEPYLFLQYSVDPHYYPAAEAAFRARKKLIEGSGISKVISAAFLPLNFIQAGPENERTSEILREEALNNTVIVPGAVQSGYVYTRVDEGMKSIPVQLMGEKNTLKFNFVIDVPGINPDYDNEELYALMRDSKPAALDEEQLRIYLQDLPCCTKNKKGNKGGDPLNLILIGDLDDILNVFTEAGWDATEKLTWHTTWKAIDAFLHGKGYRYMPVSDLFFDGRRQDAAFQRIRSTINERMHMRLWFTPEQFEGKPVWVGAVSRDIGVKFTLEGLRFTTHVIDPDLDEMRDYVFSDLASIDRVELAGYVTGSLKAPKNEPAKNLTDDPFYSDGLRMVIKVSDHDVQPEFLGWQTPWLAKAREEEAARTAK